MKKSFKIKIGYGSDEYIPIEKSELSKAYYTFMTEGKMITNDGYAIRGKDIIRIEPNWNGIMGYNKDYKLTGEDYEYIGEKRMKEAHAIMGEAKDIARQVTENNNLELLERNITLHSISNTSDFGKKLAQNLSMDNLK